MAQVRSHHPQPQPPLHPVLPVESAFVPAIIATQTRDSALHARTPPIAAPKSSGMLKSLAFSRELARSRNGHQPDACFLQSGLCLRRVNPSISGEQSRRMLKKRLMVLHSLDSLPMLVGVGQDLITRHDACLDLIKNHLSTKLVRREDFEACRCQFNGQREPIQTHTHLSDAPSIRSGEVKVWSDSLSTLYKEAYCCVLGKRLGVREMLEVRQRQ